MAIDLEDIARSIARLSTAERLGIPEEDLAHDVVDLGNAFSTPDSENAAGNSGDVRVTSSVSEENCESPDVEKEPPELQDWLDDLLG